MARPSALQKDPGLADRICEKIERGNYPTVAAQSEGVPQQTYSDWMRWGEAGKEPYAAFSVAVARALASAEVAIIEQLRELPTHEGKADNAQARALQWLLERTRSERYGAKIEVQQKAEETLRDALHRIRPRLSEGAWREVLAALADLGGE